MAFNQPPVHAWSGQPLSGPQLTQTQTPHTPIQGANIPRRTVTRKAVGQATVAPLTPRARPASVAGVQPLQHQHQQSNPPANQQHQHQLARSIPPASIPLCPSQPSHVAASPMPSPMSELSITSSNSSSADTVITTPATSPFASPEGLKQSPQQNYPWPTTTQHPPAATVHQNVQTSPGSGIICSHCNTNIPVNVSVYSCLICSTGLVSTSFCVWCFTSGAAGGSHPHDKAFYVTDSDLRIVDQAAPLLPSAWIARRNVAGKMWYTHTTTGLKTHIRPNTAAFPPGPTDPAGGGGGAGWHERRTAEGKAFWFNGSTGVSSWTKPAGVASMLPHGWREMRTPDLVAFYVNDALSLSTWDRPGEQAKTSPTRKEKGASAGTRSFSSAMSTTGAKSVGAAVGGVALLTATGKMIGKMGKSKNLKKMTKLVSQASSLAGGEFEFEYGGEEAEAEVEAEESAVEEEAVVVEEQPYPTGNTAAYAPAQEPYAYQQAPPEQYTQTEVYPSQQQPPPEEYIQPQLYPPQQEALPLQGYPPQAEYPLQPQMSEQAQMYEQPAISQQPYTPVSATPLPLEPVQPIVYTEPVVPEPVSYAPGYAQPWTTDSQFVVAHGFPPPPPPAVPVTFANNDPAALI